MQRYSPRSALTWKRKSVVLQRRPWANTTGSPGPPLSSYWSSAPSTWIRGMRGGLPPGLLASILNGRMGRSGSADLPLHGGRVPEWLASRMARLGTIIVEALLLEEGPHGVLRRLAHPFWFQALGCVMGMDWHSSGITTSVLGALKRGLAGRDKELGLAVCGGRGGQSRKTPGELVAFGERTGVDGAALARTSRLVAKVDSAAVQDGFDLYLHGFVVANDGAWTVVQQGMNTDRRQARRYHWLSEGVRSFVEEPHAAIEGRPGAAILNLTARRAGVCREATLALSHVPERWVHTRHRS